jgi:hypothetical protein
MKTNPTPTPPEGVIVPKGMKYVRTDMIGGYPQHAFIEDKPSPEAGVGTGGGDVRTLAREQMCGCVVCVCEDEEQCQGCGARHCGTHRVGQIPNPIFDDRADRAEARVRELEEKIKRLSEPSMPSGQSYQ